MGSVANQVQESTNGPTVALVGQLLALAWAAEKGRVQLPSSRDLTHVFLRGADTMPDGIRRLVHVQDSDIGEPTIKEMTAFIAAAQQAGLVKRDNPAYVAGSLQIGAFEAANMLRTYGQEFAPIVDWLRQQARSHDS